MVLQLVRHHITERVLTTHSSHPTHSTVCRRDVLGCSCVGRVQVGLEGAVAIGEGRGREGRGREGGGREGVVVLGVGVVGSVVAIGGRAAVRFEVGLRLMEGLSSWPRRGLFGDAVGVLDSFIGVVILIGSGLQ